MADRLDAAAEDRIRRALANGAISSAELPQLIDRLADLPPDMPDLEAVDRAIENTTREKWSRWLNTVRNVTDNPQSTVDAFGKRIEERGIGGVALDLGVSIATSPFRMASTLAGASTGGYVEPGNLAESLLGATSLLRLGKSAIGRGTKGALAGSRLKSFARTSEVLEPFASGDEGFIEEVLASGVVEGGARLLEWRKKQNAPSEATGGAGVVPPLALSAPTDPRRNWQGAVVGDPYTRGAYNQGVTVGQPYSQPRAGLPQPPPAGLPGSVGLGIPVGAPYGPTPPGSPQQARNYPAAQPSTAQNQNLGQFGGRQAAGPTRGGQGQPTQAFGSTLYSDPFSAAIGGIAQAVKRLTKGNNPLLKNSDGTPITVYHGTPVGRITNEKRSTDEHGGMYFSNTPNVSATYIRGTRETGNEAILRVHLIMKRPLIVESTDIKESLDAINNAQANGYDGIIFRNDKDVSFGPHTPVSPSENIHTYKVFSHNQIIDAHTGKVIGATDSTKATASDGGTTLYSDPFSAAFQMLPSLFARAGQSRTSAIEYLKSKLSTAIASMTPTRARDLEFTPLREAIAEMESTGEEMSRDVEELLESGQQGIDRFINAASRWGVAPVLNNLTEILIEEDYANYNLIESGMPTTEGSFEPGEGTGESGIQSTVQTSPNEPVASDTSAQGNVDTDTSDIDDLMREIEELTDDTDGGTTLYSDPFSATFDWAGKYLERHLKGAWRGRPTVKRQPGQPAQPIPTPNQQASATDPRYIRDSILGNMLPWTRQKLAQLRSIYRAGYTNMERIGEVGDELAKKLQIYLELKPRQFSGHELRQIQPFFQQIIDYARTVSRRRNAGFTSTVGNMKEQVWDHIESNAPIADPQLQTIAENMKAQWRVVLTNRAHRILRLRKRQEDAGRGFFIHFRDGTKQPWHPILEGYEWNDPAQNFTEKTTDTSFSIDDAYKRTKRLWMPREYHLSTWETWESDIKAKIKALNALSPKAAVPLFTQVGTAYRRDRDNTIFHTRDAAILDTTQFYDRQLREAGDQIKITKGEADDMWGHLERARETTLPRYKKDLDLLIADSRETWLRYGIIDAFGQADSTFGDHPGLVEVYDDIKNYIANDREAAVKAFVTTLIKAHPKFETLADVRLDARKRDDSMMILEALGDIDVNRMNLSAPHLVELEKAGLISQDGQGGYVMRSLESQYNVIGEYLSITQRRLHDAENLIAGLSGWIRNNRSSLQGQNEFVRGLSGITTAMTITHFTTLRNFLESLLITGKTGGSMFAKSLKDISTDMERTNYAKNLSGDNLASTLYYAEGSNIQQRWLNFTMHTNAEGYSRLIGVVSGIRLAQDVITKYAKNQSRANRSMLEHILINPAVVDQFLAEGYTAANLETIFAEHIKRVNANEATIEGEPTAGAPLAKHNYTDRIGDEIRRAANHVSDDIFKQYNAGSLPDFLARRDVPMLNLLFKFKAWGAQQHKWLRKELWYGVREARQGNWTPIIRLTQGLTAVGVSGWAMRSLYSLIAGNPGEDDWFNPEYIISSAAGAGALGLFSNIVEFTRYADGNSFKGMNQLFNFGLGPAGGLSAEIGGEILAGDPLGVGAKILQRAPVLNLAYRARGIPELPTTLGEAFNQ